MRTKAIPLSGGIWEKNCSNASSPPAEAPMPTTKKPFSLSAAEGDACSGCAADCAGLAAFMALFSRPAFAVSGSVDILFLFLGMKYLNPNKSECVARGFTPLDNGYQTGDTMKIHKFFQSHVTHYNTISHGVYPPPLADHACPRLVSGKGRRYIFLLNLSS